MSGTTHTCRPQMTYCKIRMLGKTLSVIDWYVMRRAAGWCFKGCGGSVVQFRWRSFLCSSNNIRIRLFVLLLNRVQ